ncbi:uncharacterized protein METZ01_LOCUS407445 [marine metagenome]|uniref:Large ribosomal RNA subunit accumulation protein YceD n=1 Tax=marine metagenome TaxID=408172 RepID=A0A382W8Z5_9ZZZZ
MLAEYIGAAQLNDRIAREVTLNETLAVVDMPRLVGLSHRASDKSAECLDVRVEFLKVAGDFPGIKVTVNGNLALECQRCLEPLEWSVDNSFELGVLASDNQMDETADIFDMILVGERGLYLPKVIEDEILTALPLALIHHRSEDCGKLMEVYERAADVPAARAENKPFSDLAALIGIADARKK